MKMKLLSAILGLLACATVAQAGTTNTTYSQTNIVYMMGTNRVAVSNEVWLATTTYASSNLTYAISNLQWLTFSNGVTTNLAVLTPGSNTVWLRVTNGLTRAVTNAAP